MSEIKIALAGNPNCGKTTLFNDLTGSTQYVGNWPGVTVEKKEGRLKGHPDVIIQDLPGIYSLSPYSQEEVVSRNYLVHDKPDVILNIVDGTNIERNLYLTTQLAEIGLPMVIAINMMDVVQKNGSVIDSEKLSEELGCRIVEISALKSQGVMAAAEAAIQAAREGKPGDLPHVFTGPVEHAIAHIEESIEDRCSAENLRWYAVKCFERDEDAIRPLQLSAEEKAHIEAHIKECEKELDDDAESIITNQRYLYIQDLVSRTVRKKSTRTELTTSDKIDRIVTNRWLALPIFAVIMWGVYYISVTTLGGWMTDWTNDVLFGEIIPDAANAALEAVHCAPWLQSLLVDGIIGGVGTVLGFVPQMIMLFLCLSLLEDSGYMARIAFIMDRIFRRFGLSGKSFIPMLIGTGCGVPAIMASRTIEQDKDRKMTIMLATFMPCGAKMEIIAMMTLVCFPRGNSLIAPAMYFLGLAIVVLSGIALKKTKMFAGDPAPFVMELPAYHFPTVKGVLIHVWERAKAFIIKAGTIIFSMCVVIWFLMNFGPTGMVADIDDSFLRYIGSAFAWIFRPLGFGTWQGAVASISAEVAKEQATATLGMLAHAASDSETATVAAISSMFGGSALIGMSFMLFNCFDAPCMVAIETAFREFGSKKWGWFCVAFQMGVGYVLALWFYQFGTWITEGTFTLGTAAALILALIALYYIVRPNPYTPKATDQPAEQAA